MQKRNSIISIPLICGIIVSVTAHVAALYGNGSYTPAEPLLEAGQTVVSLTLMPSLASQEHIPEASMPEPEITTFDEPGVPEIPAPVPTEPEPNYIEIPMQQPEPETPIEEKMVEKESTSSVEHIASLQLDKGVMSTAVVDGTFKPAYPRISQRRNETGTVALSIQVLPDGSVGNVDIIQSSGFRRLDESAITGAKKTTFKPALKQGQPIESTTQLSFTFNLTDD